MSESNGPDLAASATSGEPAPMGPQATISQTIAQRAAARRTRKIVFTLCIIALLIPITILGMPASEPARAGDDEVEGGVIANQRHKYNLGEGTLGDIDPASSSMNLMLLGLRGVAANQLWLEATRQKERKQWNQLEQTTNSIILLQPHFVEVWRFGGWNMAYNVSAEFDADEDRFGWVKKGAKFITKGTARNQLASDLFHELGDYLGKKVGHSDEWKQFRQFFVADPDPRWGGGPDEDLNPEGRDNYLVAKDHFQKANDVDKLPNAVKQHRLADSLFRAYPQRSLFDLAMVRQKEGRFDEATRGYWQQAYDEWVNKFGREPFQNAGLDLKLEMDNEEIVTAATDQGVTVEEMQGAQDRLANVVNYRYWKRRGQVESTEDMARARRLLYEGKKHFLGDSGFEQDYQKAEQLTLEGLTLLEELLGEETAGEDTSLTDAATETAKNRRLDTSLREQFRQEDELVEDIVKAQMIYKYLLRNILGRKDELEQGIPLQEVWDNNPVTVQEVDIQFQRKLGAD